MPYYQDTNCRDLTPYQLIYAGNNLVGFVFQHVAPLDGFRTFQPRTLQPRIFNHEFFNPVLFNQELFNHELFNDEFFKHRWKGGKFTGRIISSLFFTYNCLHFKVFLMEIIQPGTFFTRHF